MDWLQYVNNPYVFTVVVLGIVFGWQRWDGKRNQSTDATQPPVPGPGAMAASNGNGAKPIAYDAARLLIAEHVQSCPRLVSVDRKLDKMNEKLDEVTAALNVIKGKMEA
jgi:hypothetical protein